MMNKRVLVVGVLFVCSIMAVVTTRAASITSINEASFNNVEKLAPALNTNLSNLNAEVVAATAKTASGITKSVTVATNVVTSTCLATNSAGAEVAVVTNVTIQSMVLKFANGICTNAP